MKAGVSALVGVRWFGIAGGMSPSHFAPSARPATVRFLTFTEREDIAIAMAKSTDVRAIALHLGRSPSTISHEVRRNAATRGGTLDYTASKAQWHADHAARRPRPSTLAANPALRDYVEARLVGMITDVQGAAFGGPDVVWKGRRATYRQSRRWSTAPEP